MKGSGLIFRANPLRASAIPDVYDNILLTLGTDKDIAMLNRSTILAANTALAGVMIGTPVTPAVAANSLIISNITASGDILVAVNTGGHSRGLIFLDGSTGTLNFPLGFTLGGAVTGGSQTMLGLGQLSCSSATNPSFRAERTTTSLNVVLTTMVLAVKATQASMVDGHGTLLSFVIEDSTSGAFPIASISAIRDGADNEGAMLLKAGTDGAEIFLTLDASENSVKSGKTLDIGSNYLSLTEITAPGAGAANTSRVYAVANGAKTDLYAIFQAGAAVLIAAEPTPNDSPILTEPDGTVVQVVLRKPHPGIIQHVAEYPNGKTHILQEIHYTNEDKINANKGARGLLPTDWEVETTIEMEARLAKFEQIRLEQDSLKVIYEN